MRTTLTLDDDLARQLEAEMRRNGRSFRETIELLLRKALRSSAQGSRATAAERSELGLDEAAELLNVSVPYLRQILDAGSLPYRRIGEDCRIVLDDLLEFKRRDLHKRRKILAELTAEAQEMGLY